MAGFHCIWKNPLYEIVQRAENTWIGKNIRKYNDKMFKSLRTLCLTIILIYLKPSA